ncbi:MAG TPA: RraA family protein [Beijerinckiaceae bacterium]|nr:RraA family protein [Beijerinckiaceae bacterium]
MPTRMLRPAEVLPLGDEVLRGWAGIPTTIASDVCGGRLLLDPGIRPLRALGGSRLFGPAMTAWCEPADIGAAIHAIEIAQPGDIIVIDAGASLQTAVVGEHLCGVARRRGVAGLVAHAAVRDVATLAAWPDFPVFALGQTARGPVSVERGAVNDTIICGGVVVRPHDLVLADDDGVIVIPREEAEPLLAKARDKLALEQEWDRRLSAGESMLDVFGLRGS